MKKIIILITAVLIALNLIAKLIITDYDWFHLILSSLVLVSNAILLFTISSMNIADGFRVSLSFVFSFVCTALFILSQFSINVIENNWIVLSIVIVTGLEWLVLIICKRVSVITK